MGGSLIVGPYDLLDPAGPVMLLGQAGTDLGAGVPDVTTVSRILLDGDVVSGARTGNRLLKLVVLVHDSVNNAQVIADLTNAVNQPTWTIPWVPDTGKPPVVFDCYRGAVTRDWDQYLEAVTLTLTIPALPFTRDSLPTTLNPATPAGIVSLNSFDSTAGLVASLPWQNTQNSQHIYGPSNGPNTYAYDASMGGDTPAGAFSLDTASHVAGTGSVRIFQPSTLIQANSGSTYAGTAYTPFMVQGTISSTDLTASQLVSWSAKIDAGTQLVPGAFTLGGGVDATQADAGATVTSVRSGMWVLTLLDSSGRRSSWLSTNSPNAGWATFYVNIDSPALGVDTGFDITSVTGYRLRFYMAGGSGTDGAASPELYPNATSTALQNLLNCTGSTGTVIASSSGTIEWSWGSTVPVTAGQVYSGRGTVVVGIPALPTGRTFQVGIEWLNSSNAVLSTSWSAVISARESDTVDRNGTVVTANYIAEPTVSGATAPAGATQARIRARVLGAVYHAGSPSTTDQHTLAAPHITPGSTAWRYPYGTVPGSYLWLDDLKALPAGAGAILTTSYAQTMFSGVQGAARTPISIAVNAASGATPKRVLVARTPNPASAFTPFLDSPSSSTVSSTTDATALCGKNWALPSNGGGTSGGSNTYTLPAWAYGSTYAVLARLKRASSGNPCTPQVVAQIGSDTVNVTSCSRSWGASTADLAAFPLNTWSLLTLGVLTLPPKGVSAQNTAQNMTVTLSVAAPQTGGVTQGFVVDMLVLVDLAGEMLLIDQPTGAPWYWMDAAGQVAFTGNVLSGTAPDRSDAVAVTAYQSGQAVINFDPGANALTVLMDQASSGGTVAVSYFPRWTGERPA